MRQASGAFNDYSETGAVVRVPGGGNPSLLVRLKIDAVQ